MPGLPGSKQGRRRLRLTARFRPARYFNLIHEMPNLFKHRPSLVTAARRPAPGGPGDNPGESPVSGFLRDLAEATFKP